MDARFCLTGAPPTRDCSLGQSLVALVTVTATGLLLVVGAFVTGRRLAGALHRPLDAGLLVIAFAVLLAVAALLHWGWRRSLGPLTRRSRCVVNALVFASVSPFALAITLPGSSAWLLAAGWLLLASQLLYHLIKDDSGASQRALVGGGVDAENSSSGLSGDEDLAADGGATHSDPTGQLIRQRFTRATESDGSEVVFGSVRGDLESRQRTVNLHVSFCPPLDSVPDFWAEQVEGPAAQVEVRQVETYGARIDVRLHSSVSAPTHVGVEFFGRVPAASACRGGASARAERVNLDRSGPQPPLAARLPRDPPEGEQEDENRLPSRD